MRTNEELIEEFLKNGGEIQKLETITDDKPKTNVGSVSKKTQTLMTLSEGEELFGEKKPEREVKEKEVDYSGIDLSLIPEHLHKFMVKKTKET